MSNKTNERPRVTIYVNGIAVGWRFACVPRRETKGER